MADTKITALTALTAADPANDVIPIVDVSDTSMAASGTTKKISVNNILGASGTATLASATITGDLTVDTSTLKVDSTNNRVGIGLASGMTAPLEVQSNTSGTSINMRGRSDNSGAMRFFANDGTTQQAYISADDTNIDILSVSTRPIRLSVNAVVVASALNGGNFSIANGNLVMSTSGKGIDFSAVTGGTGTATANVLNDYEEGTWTPVVADASSGGNTGTCTINSAKYTKIGRVVSVECDISAITTTGMTAGNALNIRGLPFVPANGANGNFYTYRVGRNASTVSSSVYAPGSVTTLQFYLYSTNSATTDIRIIVSDIVSTTSQIVVSVTYIV